MAREGRQGGSADIENKPDDFSLNSGPAGWEENTDSCKLSVLSLTHLYHGMCVCEHTHTQTHTHVSTHMHTHFKIHLVN